MNIKERFEEKSFPINDLLYDKGIDPHLIMGIRVPDALQIFNEAIAEKNKEIESLKDTIKRLNFLLNLSEGDD